VTVPPGETRAAAAGARRDGETEIEMSMTKVRELTGGDVIDLQALPYEIDLDENPLVEFELAVVDEVNEEDGVWWIATEQHGVWRAPDPDFEFEVQTRVRR